MKKILTIILILTLLCGLIPFSASAAVAAPTVESTVKNCTFSVYTSHTVILTARFKAPESGTLAYQWYVSDIDEVTALTAIPGANSVTYTPPKNVGVKYYCVAAWVVDGDAVSEKTFDRLARVEFTATTVKVDSMTLNKAPAKTTYYPGETLDLTGMHVTISSGYDIIESFDGNGIIASTAPLTKLGEQTISITYGNRAVTSQFTINVIPPEEVHTHEFGEWFTISSASCGIDGSQMRRCSCGEDETAILPATGQHNWQIVTDEAGNRYYKCPDCLSERQPSSGPDVTIPQTSEPIAPPAPKKDSGKFPWWIVIIIVVALLIGGTALYMYLLELKRRQKKAARKRPQLPE